MSERVPASTIGELDVHLSFLQRDLQRVADAVANMATREDLQQLHSRIDKMATQADVDALRAKIEGGSVGTTLDRWSAVVTRVATTAAAIAALVALVVHLAGKLA